MPEPELHEPPPVVGLSAAEKEDTSRVGNILRYRLKQLAASRQKPHSRRRGKRNARAAERAGIAREFHESLRTNPDEITSGSVEPSTGSAWRKGYRTWNDWYTLHRHKYHKNTRARAWAGVVAAHAHGFNPLVDMFDGDLVRHCESIYHTNWSCANKDIDFDHLYPDSVMVSKVYYKRKLDLVRRQAKCAEFRPFRCLECGRPACAKHETGRQCPECGESTLCAECTESLAWVRDRCRANWPPEYIHSRDIPPTILTMTLRKVSEAEWRETVDAMSRCRAHRLSSSSSCRHSRPAPCDSEHESESEPQPEPEHTHEPKPKPEHGHGHEHEPEHTPQDAEDGGKMDTDTDADTDTDTDTNAIDITNPTPDPLLHAPVPSCCKRGVVFLCLRCLRSDACSAHEVGRTCQTCKAPTICKACGKKDAADLQAQQRRIRASFAKAKEFLRASRRPVDAKALLGDHDHPVIHSCSRVDFDGTTLSEGASKKHVQTSMKHALGNVQAQFTNQARCHKHRR